MGEPSPSRASPSGPSRGSSGRAPSGGAPARATGGSLCAFWIGEKAYALQTRIVGEVLNVAAFIPVPGTPPPVLGLFNLRGTPVSLVDLGAVLGLPSIPGVSSRSRTVLVLRYGEAIFTGVLVDRVDLVVQAGLGLFTARDASDGDAVVQGFLEIEARQGLVITVLDPAVLFQRLESLKFR